MARTIRTDKLHTYIIGNIFFKLKEALSLKELKRSFIILTKSNWSYQPSWQNPANTGLHIFALVDLAVSHEVLAMSYELWAMSQSYLLQAKCYELETRSYRIKTRYIKWRLCLTLTVANTTWTSIWFAWCRPAPNIDRAWLIISHLYWVMTGAQMVFCLTIS
jgi:hypothetical protein